MNGIYDFEMKRTPYLDVEMLLERKAKKREKQMLILSCVLVTVMMVVGIVTLVALALIDENAFVIAATVFVLYVVIGVVCVGKFARMKEVGLWQQSV